MCFSILQDIFFRRDKTEADRGAGLGSSIRKSAGIRNTQKMLLKKCKADNSARCHTQNHSEKETSAEKDFPAIFSPNDPLRKFNFIVCR